MARCQQKTTFFPSLLLFLFLKVHLHQSSKIKSQKEYGTVLLVDGRIWIWIRTNNHGSGSKRPKNIRIRIHNTGFSNKGLWFELAKSQFQ
jgi:hypothetical protein